MQEVEIIVSLIKVAAFFISFKKIISICLSGEECAKASGGGGEGGGGKEDPEEGEVRLPCLQLKYLYFFQGGQAVQGEQGGDAFPHWRGE